MKKLPDFVVELPSMGGRGVLCGSLILTAAHCIKFEVNGSMALGEHFFEEVKTWKGRFRAAPVFVEPLSDVCVLAAPDDQVLPDDAEAFESFAEATKGPLITSHRLKVGSPLAVQILNKDRSWDCGDVEIFSPRHEWVPKVCVQTKREIKGGASGGPVIDDQGRLAGIVSHGTTSKVNGLYPAEFPFLPVALPEWILRQMRD